MTDRSETEPGYDRKREASKAALDDAVRWMLHMDFADADVRGVVEALLDDDERCGTDSSTDSKERHRLRRLLMAAICRKRGHDFHDQHVGDGKSFTYCRRCKLGEN